MAVLKMKFVSIMGPVDQMNDMIEKYLSTSSIQSVDALNVSGKKDGLYRFSEPNLYTGVYKKYCDASRFFGIPYEYERWEDAEISVESAEKYVDSLEGEYTALVEKRQELKKTIDENSMVIAQLEHLLDVDVRLDDMFHFQFMRFRFGRMTKEAYSKLVNFMGDMEFYFIKSAEETGYVYGMYLTPHVSCDKVDSIFASLNFERIRISEKAHGKPLDGCYQLEQENLQLMKDYEKTANDMLLLLQKEKSRFLQMCSFIKHKYECFNIRDYALRTKGAFYITGWMPGSEADRLNEELEKEKDIMAVVTLPKENEKLIPPTVLKNNPLVRPFESFVKMYGLPSYHEIDPTPIMALTYVLMFGMMFGDLGQGLVLTICGLLFAIYKKSNLGAIFSLAGLSAAFFGVMYGSVFGNESLIAHIWLSPLHDSNSLLLTAVGVGVVMLLGAMCVNVVNAVKNRDYGRLLFNQNGLAGIVVYMGGVLAAFGIVRGSGGITWPIAILMFFVPLCFILLQEPLGKFIAGKKSFMPQNKGEFFTESFFELIEIVLSYITNTISFIRIGAFALAHAGMMMVVYEFVDLIGGVGSISILIFGNLFVMGMEGFIVGIQTLRLEFYELFGRFYRGEGEEFKPLNKKIRENL